MMNLISTYLKIITVFFLITLNSCALDETVDPFSDSRDKFVGTWSLVESQVARSIFYPVTISKDPSNSSQVILWNMGNLKGNAYGIVTTSKIVISSQEIDGLIIEGTGTYLGNNSMSWEYSISGAGDIEYFEATATN